VVDRLALFSTEALDAAQDDHAVCRARRIAGRAGERDGHTVALKAEQPRLQLTGCVRAAHELAPRGDLGSGDRCLLVGLDAEVGHEG
jgi:hypothetical protein